MELARINPETEGNVLSANLTLTEEKPDDEETGGEAATIDDQTEQNTAQDATIALLFDYKEPGYATVRPKGTIGLDDETPETLMLRGDLLPTPPPTPQTPPDSRTTSTSIPIEAEVCVKVLNISSDTEEFTAETAPGAQPDLTDGSEGRGDMEDSEVRPRTQSEGATSFLSRTTNWKTDGLNENTGSFHYETGWIASANVKVRIVDDYHKQVAPDDDVLDNEAPESKHSMMSRWVLFRTKLNSELISKLLDPRRVGRCEPTRVYTVDQGTSKFAIFTAKRDRSLQHTHALYLHPETYISMGIPRVRSSSVRETAKRLSQNLGDQVDRPKDNGMCRVSLRKQISGAVSDYYSSRDKIGSLFRGELGKGSAVQTFRPRSKSMRPNDSKQKETKRSTESIQLALDFA